MRKENKCCVVIFLVAFLMVTSSCGLVGAGMAFIPTSVVKNSTMLDQEILTASLSSSVNFEKINILDFFNSFDRASCLADWRETSGSANWQESSATVGQTIHADFTWTNAQYHWTGDCYACMYIHDPSGNTHATYIAEASPTGSYTLSCTADQEGTWSADISVWDGSQWLPYSATLYVNPPPQTSGSANWQESSATVGQTIHADFTWTNAHWKPSPYDCYSDMYIKDPNGAVKVEFLGEQSSGGYTLSFTADMAGTWLAEIKVWDGSNWLTYPDTLPVSSPPQDLPPTACYNWADADGNGQGTTINFDASCSTDDYGISTYQWDWTNDGSYDYTDYDPYCSYDYGNTNSHDCKLKVIDTNDQDDTVINTVYAIANPSPTVEINYPVNGQTVGGIITITGAADDDGSVTRVEVKIDSGTWQQANGQYTWSIAWDSTSVENGPHTISAKSFDGQDYSDEKSVSVKVDNSDPDFFFIHISDLHLSVTTYAEGVWGSFVKLVKNMNPQPAFIVCTGDIVDTGACTAGEITYQLFTLYGLDKTDSGWNLEGTNIPIYFCPGNHDAYGVPDVSLNFDNYRNFIGPFYYNQNFPVAGHTVSIFSLTGGIDTELLNGMSNGDGLDDKYGEEVTNFQSDLANSNADIKIVLCHQGYVIPYDNGYFENYNRHITGDPNDFGKWCTDYGVDVVCTGHIHAGSVKQKDSTDWPILPLSNGYWKTNTDDTMYVSTSEIGANIIDPGDGGRHYRVINVYSDGSIKTLNGQQYASFSESKITNNLLVNKQISQSFSSQLLQNMFEKTLYNQQQNQQYGQSSQQLSQMILKQSQSSR